MVRLSVEELALILIQHGQVVSGQGVMQATLGDIGSEEMRFRLLSAGHSLIARELMRMEKDGRFTFSDPVKQIVRPLTKADFSIRYSKSVENGEENLSYHFAKGSVFEHSLEQGIIHIISEVKEEVVVKAGWIFFNGEQTAQFQSSLVEVDNALFEQIMANPDQEEVSRRLVEAGVTKSEANLIAEDMQNSKYRGSALRVEYDKDNLPTSNRGILTLRGPNRMWLVRPQLTNGNGIVTLRPASQAAFAEEVTSLIKKRASS